MLAQSLPNLKRFGHNATVAPNETLQDVSCVLCSVAVNGNVSGNVHVFAGDVLLDGKVAGNVLVVGGNLSVTSRAQTEGSVIVFGGHLRDGSFPLTHPPRVISALIFLPALLILCIGIGTLIRLTRRMVRGPLVYPPLPRL
jgi:hypothetical protein